MDWLTSRLGELFGLSPELLRKLALTLLTFMVYFALRALVSRVASARVDDPLTRFRISRAGRVVLALIALFALARVWVRGTEGLGTWLGLLSAGLAVALQDPLENLAGWLYLAASRPFKVGDRIQVGSHAGDVVDIKPFSFALLEIGNWVNADQSTGRVLHIPNGWVFKESVAGYDHGFPFIWNEISVTVTFESDWRLAKQVLLDVVGIHSEKVDEKEFEKSSEFLGIQYTRLTPVVWTDAAPEGVRLTMRYLCRPRNRRVSASTMWEAILEAFAGLDRIDFAYPTTRRFDHAREGKIPLRAKESP